MILFSSYLSHLVFNSVGPAIHSGGAGKKETAATNEERKKSLLLGTPTNEEREKNSLMGALDALGLNR